MKTNNWWWSVGFFFQYQYKKISQTLKLIIFEKSNKILSKVLVSGGGRCNVTNSESSISTFFKILS